MVDRFLDAIDDQCPQCGEAVSDAHARGKEIVVVPCGHTVTAMAGLDVPPEVLEDVDP